ncbi:O-antigen ligase family protein [Mucilaginibacter auburnensis]|uniref:O-antigen ligase n=1 Tax=Mucilaginibacter auburnensis TaxID=1457233 RepID=A0A2H9VL86_9SPHI|nr:O-antigen ligase family protein [Mucilaginibacter auburnensis]PJJ79072.1 O-antigen ligase [Mucilaginibacter auburnensis]
MMKDEQAIVHPILHLNKSERPSLSERVRNSAIIEKLSNPLGIGILAVIAAIIAVGIAKFGVVFGGLVVVAFVGLPAIYCVVAYPRFGIIILLILAYVLFLLGRLGIPGPMGVVADLLQGSLMLGTLVRLRRHNDWEFLKGPVSTMILIWIAYNFLQVANPSAISREAWVYTVRGIAIVMLSYFVFLYNIRSINLVRFIFKLWLALSFFSALYGMKQEFIGFSASEEAWLHSDPEIAGLLFIAGHWRKFSIFSDPVAFAYNMNMAAIFCVALIAGKLPLWKKVILVIFTGTFLVSMLFSGTRAANVLVPAAMFLFAIIRYNKQILLLSCLGVLGLIVLINIPTGDPNLLRFQTAFRPNEDPSYKLRKFNQERIKPYIYSHPIGFGLGATGGWGKRFGNGSVVSQFQPDSGYVRVAVELGPVGLLIFCTLMFVVMRTGINNYYRIRDPELKMYSLGVLLVVFAYNIANFPQEALVQFPSNVYFSLDMALITVLYRLDKQKRQQQATQLQQAT